MDTALPQKFPFILDRNLAKANCTGNEVCRSCDTVVLPLTWRPWGHTAAHTGGPARGRPRWGVCGRAPWPTWSPCPGAVGGPAAPRRSWPTASAGRWHSGAATPTRICLRKQKEKLVFCSYYRCNGIRAATVSRFFFFFWGGGLYFQENFIWKTDILISRLNYSMFFFYVHSCWRTKKRSDVTILKWRQFRRDKLLLFSLGLAWIRGACLSETVFSLIKLLLY